MRITKKLKRRISGIILTLILLLSTTAFAEEPEADFTQVENTVVATQPSQQSAPTATPMKVEEGQAAHEPTPPPEATTPPVDPDHSEENTDSSSVTDETSTPSPAEEGSTPSPTRDELEENSLTITDEETPSPPPLPQETITETTSISIALKWDIPARDGLLRVGDSVILAAEVTTEAEGIQLQWQIATKPTNDLTENEPEWEDVSGANGEKYTFTVQEGMQSWRWRLRITVPDGETVYSDEIRLPKLTAGDEDLLQTEDEETPLVVTGTQPLPVATITLTANIPLDEIFYGDEVTLIANIHNPREDMLLQWQYMPSDMEPTEGAWQSVEGANESVYTYVVDEENTGWIWRLLITVSQEIETTDGEGSIAAAEPAVEGEAVLGVLPTLSSDTSEAPIEEQTPETEAIETVEE